MTAPLTDQQDDDECKKPCDPDDGKDCCADYWHRMLRLGFWDGPKHRWTSEMNREYEMSEEQHARLMDACKPVPYLVVGGMEPPSPQQNANAAWRSLADELGFVWDTVEPVRGKSTRFFRAKPKP